MNNFADVLFWITTGGAVAVVSWFSSWLLEDFAWWNDIKSQYKKLIILLVSAVIGVGAQVFVESPYLLDLVRPYLDAVVMVLTAWIATQVAHKADS